MNRVVRATDLLGQPVVTLSGDDLADVRDVVYNADEGRLVGFTLNKRSLFHGKLRQLLPMSAVRSIGRDAVMVDSDDALVDSGDAPPEIAEASPDRDVIGAVVLTSEGTQLGEVTDVIVSLGRRGAPSATSSSPRSSSSASSARSSSPCPSSCRFPEMR